VIIEYRCFGTMIAMFFVARLINRIDNRLFILVGFLLTAASLWQMTGYSLYMGSGPILFAGFAQGFGLVCTFVPLTLLACRACRIISRPRELRSAPSCACLGGPSSRERLVLVEPRGRGLLMSVLRSGR
jgi:hypothetical protein